MSIGWRKLFLVPLQAFLVMALAVMNTVAYAKNNDTNDKVILAHVLDHQNPLCYLEADPANGWYAQDITNKADLDKFYERYAQKKGLLIPLFPTVYSPGSNYDADRIYYDYILKQSGIKHKDKVLVIGSGSGADAWAAWVRAQVEIYTIDINVLAVANTRATANIAGFTVADVQGDITTIELPVLFNNFDYVLWNMPFILPGDYADNKFHDFDNGEILDRFLKILPRLLKKGGKAILFNTKEAQARIHFPHQEIIEDQNNRLFIITND